MTLSSTPTTIGTLISMVRIRANTPIVGDTPITGTIDPSWVTAATGGTDDPQPIDATIAVIFNTGSNTLQNSFTVNMRGVGGTDTSQLALADLMQIQLNGPQPGLSMSAALPREITSFDSMTMGALDGQSMTDLDAVEVSVASSWLSFSVSWGAFPAIQLGRSDNPAEYSWNGSYGPAFSAHTSYLAMITLVDTQARIQLYDVDQITLDIGALFFDTGIVPDSYLLIRRPGRIGWRGSLGDSDASIQSLRAQSLVYAEYRSAPLASITPVQGARLYVQSSPDIQLWQAFSPSPPAA